MARLVTITVKLPKGLLERIDLEAMRREATRSDVIRRALLVYFMAVDAAEKTGELSPEAVARTALELYVALRQYKETIKRVVID